MYRDTHAYGSAENIEALTRSHRNLTSEVLQSSAAVDASEQLEFQSVNHSQPVKPWMEWTKDHALIDGDQLLDVQNQELQDMTYRAYHEYSDAQLPGKVF